MPLDGLRAWIGEVERKLGMRTRVFLVLAALAIGGAGAAIYLAVDTRENAVRESDVRAAQEQIEARVGAGGTAAADLAQLEADLKALEAQVDRLRGQSGGSGEQKGAAAGANGLPEGATGGAGSAANLGDLLEQAKDLDEKAEEAE